MPRSEERDIDEQARRALHVLADLSPSAPAREGRLTVPTEWFRWLPMDALALFASSPLDTAPREVKVDRVIAERLAKIDRIRPEQSSLRVGWLFVAGRTKIGGRTRRVFHPLADVAVRVRGAALVSPTVQAVGDVRISELIDDLDERRRLEGQPLDAGGALFGTRSVEIPDRLLERLSGLRRFAAEASRAASLQTDILVPAGDAPDVLMRSEKLRVVAGLGIYATHATDTTTRAGSLTEWATSPIERWTAFHSLYVDAAPWLPDAPVDANVDSPFLLTPVQRAAVASSRQSPITLIAGAPGTGKSHTIVATACDALARGESVLVAAKADATVDALLGLLSRAPGPDPVVFGSNERRDALAARLAAGQLHPEDDQRVRTAEEEYQEARIERDVLRAQVTALLAAESAATDPDSDPKMPAADLRGVDLDAIEREITSLDGAPPRGLIARWRRRRQTARLRRQLGGSDAMDVAGWRDAVAVARAQRAADRLRSTGGLEIGAAQWAELARCEDRVRRALGIAIAAQARSTDRLNRRTLPAVAAVATALRSGRAARREQLRRLDSTLTTALPLWVGSLGDVEDLLPALAGLFDVVILDEASSIDQPLAAPALLRGGRGVIVGDPHQLRHVSFVSDEKIREVLDLHSFEDRPMVAARLDVRRNSTFDVAAATAPVTALDEHFRCAPHLVDFVADEIYSHSFTVATRAPSTESRDCVTHVRLEGSRDRDGIVRTEVDWTISELQRLRQTGVRSIGVVTPFRAQADALEAAVLGQFTLADLEAMDLRVGTVHAFQGNERDRIIVNLGIGPDEGVGTWRFADDPHVLAVMLTRARRHMTVLTSSELPHQSRLASYVAAADSPPGPVPSAGQSSEWVQWIDDALRTAGCATTTAYPTGRHRVDICVRGIGDGPADDMPHMDTALTDIAIEAEIDPGGPADHIDRHLALARSGWSIIEAHRSKWDDRKGELVVELLARLRAPDPSRPRC